MAPNASFCALMVHTICVCLRASGQAVRTRILPSDQLLLETKGERSRPHGSAVIWCLVQDLDPISEQVKALELFFRSAPQIGTDLDLDGDGKLFEGSFSQFGFSSGPEWEPRARSGSKDKEEKTGSTSDDGRDMDVTRAEGFPDAGFSSSNSSDSANKNTSKKFDATDSISRGNRLDQRRLLPGSVSVARVFASAAAELGVRHVQRSGVSVRGVISSSNPNLSSLQVAMRRATCSDCGKYVCVMHYRDYRGNITQARSSSDFIVAQSVTRRLNVRIVKSPTKVKQSNTSSANNQQPPEPVDLFCFGTISDPNTPIAWRIQAVNASSNATSEERPEMSKQGEPRLGKHCQYWRASLLRHVWEDDETWRFGCFLSRDEGLLASALLSKSGPEVVAECGDSNSTSPTKEGDKVTVTCDVTNHNDVTSVTWQHEGVQVGTCRVKSKTSNETVWNCSVSSPDYSAEKKKTRFDLNIGQYDVNRDKGQWGCVVTPLAFDMAASCVLG